MTDNTTTPSGADALDVAMSKACIHSWDQSQFTSGDCDAVHPMFSRAFEAGYRAALSAAQDAQAVPDINYEALIAAAYKRDRKWAQGTNGCIAFARGAEWFREQCLSAAPQPAQQPLTGEHKAILEECRNQAMRWTSAARIPESGAFGGIAQDLDYLCGQLGVKND